MEFEHGRLTPRFSSLNEASYRSGPGLRQVCTVLREAGAWQNSGIDQKSTSDLRVRGAHSPTRAAPP